MVVSQCLFSMFPSPCMGKSYRKMCKLQIVLWNLTYFASHRLLAIIKNATTYFIWWSCMKSQYCKVWGIFLWVYKVLWCYCLVNKIRIENLQHKNIIMNNRRWMKVNFKKIFILFQKFINLKWSSWINTMVFKQMLQ